jgi:hypothetical protein
VSRQRTAQRQRHHGAHLSRAQRTVAHLLFGAAWISGVLWLLFHYFLRREGEFGIEPNPLEPWWLRLHGLCAFALLWLGGLLWALHARHAMRWPHRRASGLAIVFAFCALAATGYLLYYADAGVARDAVAIAHWAIGLSLVVPMAAHALPRRARGPRD